MPQRRAPVLGVSLGGEKRHPLFAPTDIDSALIWDYNILKIFISFYNYLVGEGRADSLRGIGGAKSIVIYILIFKSFIINNLR